MNGILADLERAEYTILKVKSQFCMPRLRVIEFVCDALGRYSDIFKIIKIMKWFSPNDNCRNKSFYWNGNLL
jgi:hypothetical protein